MTSDTAAGPMPSIGRVFGRSFEIIRGNPVSVIGGVLILQALPSVVLNLLQMPLRGDVRNGNGVLGSAAISIVSAIVGLLFLAAAKAAVIHAAIGHEEGRRPGLGACVGAALRIALPLFGLSILLNIGIILGMVLLIVPGIILALMWSVSAPVLVVEKTGIIAAAGRSRFLTKGARWRILALGLVVGVVFYGVVMLLTIVAMPGLFGGMRTVAAMRAPSIGFAIGNALVTSIVIIWWYAVQASLYIELKAWKEGPSLAALNDIFA